MPLVASQVGTDELLGGVGTRPASVDALAARTLVKGEPLAAPAGRADDFSWPRREVGALSAPPSRSGGGEYVLGRDPPRRRSRNRRSSKSSSRDFSIPPRRRRSSVRAPDRRETDSVMDSCGLRAISAHRASASGGLFGRW